MKKMLIGLSSVLLASVVAVAAQEKPAPAVKPLPAITPLKVQVTLSRFSGDRKISSAPYAMSVNATAIRREAPVSVRMGVQVPVAATSKDPTSYNYRNVGTNIDCWSSPTEDGRFNLWMNVEQSSLYGEETQKRQASTSAEPPVFRSFNTSFMITLKDGETTQFISATDPVSGEVLKIDVTVNVVK